MREKRLILIGGGGHCRSCIDVIESGKDWSIQGVLDNLSREAFLSGYPVLGGDELIDSYIEKKYFFLVTVGQIKSASVRRKLFTQLKNRKAAVATIVSSKGHVSRHASLGEGVIVHHFAAINANVQVGNNCIINTFANIEHDVIIGDHCHISTSAVANGGVKIGNECFIGSGAVIANGISICSNVVIGAGAIVTRDISEEGVYVGNPAAKVNR